MIVLHILQSNRYSGAENVVCQIIRMFQTDRDIQMVYCSQDGQIREVLRDYNIDFIPISNCSAKEIRRVINHVKPDIIHAHDMRASFFASLVCGNIPLISHIHNNAFDSRSVSIKSIAYLFAGFKAKRIIWVSRSSLEGYAFHKQFINKSVILYNIIDIDSLYKKVSEDQNDYSFDIAFIGRMTYQKNPQRLIDICEKAINVKSDIKVALVGTGDLDDTVNNMIVQRNLSNNITFLGYLSNPLKLLSNSKIMLMTSRWEGTPMIALEAMALGVPIVSTPVDGLKDLVINGVTGYLLDKDSDIVNTILTILDDEKIYKQLSRNEIEQSLVFNNKEKYKSRIIEVYRSCNV